MRVNYRTRALMALPGLLMVNPCMACTTAAGNGGYASTLDVPVEKRDAPFGTNLMSSRWGILGNGTIPTNFYFSGCSPGERVAIVTQLTGPLTYVADIVFSGRTFAAYALTPTSPLFIFQHVTEIGTGTGAQRYETPVRDLSNISAGAVPPVGNTETVRSSFIRYSIFARGGLMTTVSGKRVTLTMSPQAYPALKSIVSMNKTVAVEQPTCTLTDQNVQLDDIAAVNFATPGPSSYSKRFTITLKCNLAGSSIRMAIRDAGSSTNNTTELTPTSDSTAQGVRLQLLRNAVPVAMNTSWTAPSVKGDITLDMAARYYRLAGPFLSGSIGGKATLTVDYQ